MKSFAQHTGRTTPQPLTEAFSRQHYEAIAKVIKNQLVVADENTVTAVENIANALANIFAQDNYRFDKGFFLNKCGI